MHAYVQVFSNEVYAINYGDDEKAILILEFSAKDGSFLW